jgi:hypothetical protein
MRIDHENPMTPTDAEAEIDHILDLLAPHQCNTCEWCIAVDAAAANMLPSVDLDPPF